MSVFLSSQRQPEKASETCANVHLCGKNRQSFIEIVHLDEDAYCCQDHEDIGRRMRELIAARKSELQGNAKCLDGHDGHGADSRTYGQIYQGILFAVNRSDLVDHDGSEYDHDNAVQEVT